MASTPLSYLMEGDDYQKKLALMLAQNSFDTSPKQHWAQGAAQLAQALLAGSMAKDQQDEQTKGFANLQNLPGLGGSPTGAMPQVPGSAAAFAVPPSGGGGPSNDMSQPRGIRNNNPLNLEASEFTRGQPGFSGVEPQGRHAQFGTPEQGMAAADNLLQVYSRKYGLNTPEGIVGRWAPTSDGNNVPAYAGFLAKQMGVAPNGVLDMTNPQVRQALISAMGQYENGRPVGPPSQGAPQGQPTRTPVNLPPEAPGQQPISSGAPAGFAQTAQAGPPPGIAPAPNVTVPGATGVAPATPMIGQTRPQPTQGRTDALLTPERAAAIRQLLSQKGTIGQGLEMYKEWAKPTDRYEVVMGPDGRPVGQRSMLTGKTDPYPQGPESQSDVEYMRRNWQTLGLPDPNSTDPKSRTWWNEFTAKRMGGAGTNVTVDQRGASEFEKVYGEGMGKQALAVIEAGNTAPQTIQRVQLLKAMNNAIETNKLAPLHATVGGYLQSFGINPSVVGLDPNLPATAESMRALTNEMTLSKIGAGGMPANNFSDADRKFLEKTQSSLEDRPEANALKLEVAERVARLSAEKADRFAEMRGQNPNVDKLKLYEEFDRNWRKEQQGRNMFGDLAQQFNAMPGASVKSPVPGAPPPGGVRRYNPATGKIE